MIAIVATYYNREKQLLKTLESFKRYNPEDFNVVIVDDNSPEDISLPDLSFEVTILKLKTKQWINPGLTFNIGFDHALESNPEAIVIQNAECYHNGDIIASVKQRLTKRNYLSFACYSLGKNEDVNLTTLNKRAASGNGDSAWYNHSRYRPVALHFCCAITSENLRKLNGFDERFAMGLGYEDDYFIHQVRTLGLKVEIIDNPFVFHQYHYDVKAFNFDLDLYNRTAFLCNQLKAEKKYRAERLKKK